MHRIRRLRNPIRDYAWGSRTALAELLGRPHPTDRPEAELWMGAHPAAPSQVADGAGWVPLPEWIRRDPAAVLGHEVARRFGGELPFLMKVLAVARALSVQAHPDAERARAGFEREERAGIPRGDPRRLYRDPSPKPELICALTGFTALCGFRETGEMARSLEGLGVPELAETARALRAAPGREGLARALRSALEAPAGLAAAVAAAAQRRAGDAPEYRLVAELGRQHPGDPGLMAPLWLQHIELAPGQALFLPPGELHAYLEGVGVEILANSDNVLRGGLTEKTVDVPELLAALTFRQAPVPRIEPRPGGPGEGIYPTPAREFELAVLAVAPAAPHASRAAHPVEILLCTRGEARIEGAVAPGAERLARGEAVLVPAAAGAYTLRGDATVYRASVP
jgi:mannose-6-phosphate isomerase